MALTDIDIANMALTNKLGSAKVNALADRDDINLTNVYNQVRDEVLQLYPWQFALKRTRLTAKGLLNCSARTITFVNSNPDTIIDSGSGFVTAGFEAGDIVVVGGSSSNDGKYGIASVATGTLTLETYEEVTAEILVNDTDLKLYAKPSNIWNYKYSKPSDCLDIIAVEETTIYNQPNWDVEGDYIVTDEISEDDQIAIEYIKHPTKFTSPFVTCFTLKLAAELAIPITNDKTLKDSLLTEFHRTFFDYAAKSAGRSHADEARPETSWEKR